MKRSIVALVSVGIVFGLSASADSVGVGIRTTAINTSPRAEFYPDRVIVKTKSGLNANQIGQKLAVASGLEFERTLAVEPLSLKGESASYALMKVDPTQDSVEEAIARLQTRSDVEFAQPDYIYTKSAVPNDPDYGKLWGLKNTGQTITSTHLTQSVYSTGNPGTSGKDMDLETAWNTLTDCSSVIVAVIDTGIKLDHTDLSANLWTNGSSEHGYDYVNSDTDPTDDEGHGTHVAGTIGARGDNAIGTTGVCWRVQLMAIKVLDATGSGSTSSIISGINFARTNGAHIINMSLGGSTFDQLFFNAVKTASDAGILMVVAAGNDGRNNGSIATYPCNYEVTNVLCVGAVDQNFSIATFSNYSTTFVDVGAPGTNIISDAINSWGAPISVPLTVGTWTLSSANFAFASGYLQNPSNWNGTNLYANSQNDTAYTPINMTGTTGGIASISLRGEAQYGFDYLDVYERSAGGDPVSSGTRVARMTGTSAGALITTTVTLTDCANSATCTVGFNFTTNTSTTKVGYRIQQIDIDTKTASLSALDGLNGTSMASPHVAGLAALVKANNPTFTAADLKNAIVLTGTKLTPLASVFLSGAVANAPAAIKYVDTPLGVAAAVVP